MTTGNICMFSRVFSKTVAGEVFAMLATVALGPAQQAIQLHTARGPRGGSRSQAIRCVSRDLKHGGKLSGYPIQNMVHAV